MKNMYINQLPCHIQNAIEKNIEQSLSNEGLSNDEISEAIENAMNSRLSDLSDTIDIEQYL